MSQNQVQIKLNSDAKIPASSNKIEDGPEDDGDVDFLDGFLNYDMNQFHGLLGENLDLEMVDDSDSEKEQIDDQDDHIDEAKRITRNTQNGSVESGSMQNSQPNKGSLVKEKKNMKVQGSQIDPAEGDEESLYYNFEEQSSQVIEEASNEEDLSFFDSMGNLKKIEENFGKQENNFLIKYPNHDCRLNLFCPKIGDADPELGGNQIILRNSELLTDDRGKMDDFYEFLQELDFQQKDRVKSQENIAMQLQLSALQKLGQQFQNMRKMQQKWLEISPSHTFSNRLQAFSLQLERFSQSIKLIQESFSFCRYGRRITPMRTEFYFTDPDRQKNLSKKKEDPENTKNQEDDVNYNQDKPPESTQLCVAFFRGLELYKLFNMYQHLRIRCEKFSQLQTSQQRIKSRIKTANILKHVTLIQKKNKKPKYQESFDLNSEQNTIRNIIYNSNQKKIQGLSSYFQTELNKKKTNSWWEDEILYKEKNQSKSIRFSANKFQQFNLGQNDDFTHYTYE